MPTYEYECQKCRHTFEQFHSIKAEPIKKCPKCGKNGVKRLLGSGAGVIFKGSGFYQTDYRSSGYKQAAKADSTPPAKSDSTSTSTAKPESKASTPSAG